MIPFDLTMRFSFVSWPGYRYRASGTLSPASIRPLGDTLLINIFSAL